MKQNVFMGSMYFFIPLVKRRLSCTEKNKKRCWTKISPPPFIKDQCSSCEFSFWITNDRESTYYFDSYKMNGHEKINRKISLNNFILRYYPDNNKDAHRYIFVVGACIDKLFSPCHENDGTTLQDLLCTQNDIVFLKRAFYETGTRGLYPIDQNHQKSFRQWLSDEIKKAFGTEQNDIRLIYSVVDLIGIDIEDYSWTTKEMLDIAFSHKYYEEQTPMVEEVLSGNIEQFAYGILFGNDNFARLPDRECHEVLNNGYSNNISEITYAANNTILFLHTHHAYLFNPKNVNRQKQLNSQLNGAQNIIEICDVIYARQKIHRLKNNLQESDAALIKETLLSISKFITSDLFNLSEMDRKMDYIYQGLGVYKEHKNLMKAGELAASVAEIKGTQRTNKLIIVLTAVTTLLTLLQLFNIHH